MLTVTICCLNSGYKAARSLKFGGILYLFLGCINFLNDMIFDTLFIYVEYFDKYDN